MVRLEKELGIDEVRLYGEGSQIIATDGSYESEINLGKDAAQGLTEYKQVRLTNVSNVNNKYFELK